MNTNQIDHIIQLIEELSVMQNLPIDVVLNDIANDLTKGNSLNCPQEIVEVQSNSNKPCTK